MKTFTMAIAAVAVVLGLAGGTAAYTLASDPAATTEQVSAEPVAVSSPTETATPDEPKVRFKPCKAPTHREGKNCVEDIVETVVLAAPAPDQSQDNRGNSDDDGSGPRDKDKGNNRDDDSDDDGDDRDHDDDDDSHDDDSHEGDTGEGDDD